jgi:hypothetical protein
LVQVGGTNCGGDGDIFVVRCSGGGTGRRVERELQGEGCGGRGAGHR